MQSLPVFHPLGGVNSEAYNYACKLYTDRAKKHSFLLAGKIKLSNNELSPVYGYVYQVSTEDVEMFELCLLPDSHLDYFCGQVYFESLEEIELWAKQSNALFIPHIPSITEALAFSAKHDKEIFKGICKAL